MKNFKTLATVESLTGGALATSIVSYPGASQYFVGSLVTYQTDFKTNLGIDISHGVISAETALSMAKKGYELTKADLVIALTGNAGPTRMENKKIGKVYIAFNDEVIEKQFAGDRVQIRYQCVEFVMKYLEDEKLFMFKK
ncbi:nicotinamide-nucleotide amidase [Mycoplasma testudineum]|uniref:Nicotinamide-nucleotide amidase n=1 Tax=Mycoplasma testudineum TaxID=244584 RepID=A0A4R6IDX4_9MOLU|nr:CinA family protein [Mycoplasma testudineum]OYD26921.1 competence protein [Mycoplasma testudineum]TDO20470.1 nicotinamide-nucleotide amidase [Mycoplasma testudineum]